MACKCSSKKTTCKKGGFRKTVSKNAGAYGASCAKEAGAWNVGRALRK